MGTQEKRIKTEMVRVRVTPDDHAALVARARDVKLTVPGYMLSCALGRRTRSQADAHILEALRQLAEQQRELHRLGGNAFSVEYGVVLAEIVGAMRRLGG